MIIVSQDKKEIVNFDTILSVKLYHDDEDKECLYEIYTTVNAPGDNYILLGTYATEERAKKVLQEIIEEYKEGIDYCVIDEQEWMAHNNVYEMPEE